MTVYTNMTAIQNLVGLLKMKNRLKELTAQRGILATYGKIRR